MSNRIFILVPMILIGFCLFSQDKPVVNENKKLVIDVDTAVKLALANNLDIKTQKMKIDSTGWSLYTSWNYFVPKVTLAGTLSRSALDNDARSITSLNGINVINIPPTNATGVGIPSYSTTIKPIDIVSATLNLSLDLNASLFFKVYQTALDYQSGKIGYEAAKNNIILNVKTSLYNIILLKQTIDVDKENIAILEKSFQQVLSNYKNGFSSEYDMLSAQVAYENSKPALAIDQNKLANALLSFKELLGLKNSVDIDVNANIVSDKKTFDSKDLIAKYLNSNLDIKTSLFNFRTSQNSKNTAISALSPNFNISFLLDPTFQNEALDPNQSWWSGTSNWNTYDRYYVKNNWYLTRAAFSITLTLPLSALFPFGQEQMGIIKAQYTESQNKIGYQQTIDNTIISIQNLVNTLESTNQTIGGYKLTVDLAIKAYQKVNEAYAAGYKQLLDVQTQEGQLEQAKLNLLNAEFTYTQNLLSLENLLNTALK